MTRLLRYVTAFLVAVLLISGVPVGGQTATKPENALPWLGMKFRWIKGDDHRRIQHVERVTPNGPAARAGLRTGDLILTIAGRAVGFGDDLDYLLYLSDRKPGERLKLDIVREGRPLRLVIVVGTMPDAARAAWRSAFERAKQMRIKTAAHE
jgi:predicted metalloprotease with PDZ domain